MEIDFHSPVWLAIAKLLETYLQDCREANDTVVQHPENRAANCGEIRLCKKLLALPEEADRAREIALSGTQNDLDY